MKAFVMRPRGQRSGPSTVSPDEIGQLAKRVIVLVKTYMSGMIRCYQQNPNASRSPAFMRQ
jgi:hypothetical protein